MKSVKNGFMGLLALSALAWVSAPVMDGTAFADNYPPATTPAAPAAAAPAATPAPAAPAKPAVKKVAKKAPKKSVSHAPTFMGVIKGMDMNSSPMTLVVVKDSGKKSEFVFGGDVSMKTAVHKGKKKVGMDALKEGQNVVLHYANSHGSVMITSIWIR